MLRWRSDAGREPNSWTAFRPYNKNEVGIGELRSSRGDASPYFNIGDPSIQDLFLFDSALFDGVEPRVVVCAGCAFEYVVLIEIRNGAVMGSVSCPLSDERVNSARAMADYTEAGPQIDRYWDHGVADEDLVEIYSFLEDYDLVNPETYRDPQTGSSDSDLRLALIGRIRYALLEGYLLFSTRLLCHAIARKIGSDPAYPMALLELKLRDAVEQYNNDLAAKRAGSSIGMLTPTEYENQHQKKSE